jgi:uncharacterized protein YrrD
MRLGKELINKPIYTIDTGTLIGKSQDLYVDDALEVVLGIYLGAQGLVRRRAQLIRSGDVVIFGQDAILVKSANVITDDGELSAAKAWLRRDKLAGRDVDTPGGTRLGQLGDVLVESDGRVSGFAMSKVFVEGPLAEKRVIDRSAIIDTGSADGRMTIDLTRLEAALANAPALPPEAEGEEIPITVEPPKTTE